MGSSARTATGATLGDTVFYDVIVVTAGPNGTLGDGDDVALPTVTTDASGTWTLSGLPPGLYQVSVDLATVPPGLVNSFDPDGGNDATSELTLAADESNLDQNFGYLVPAVPTGALALTGASTVSRLSLSGVLLLGAGIVLVASPWLRTRVTAQIERRRAQSIG